jgi:hypothetical protein
LDGSPGGFWYLPGYDSVGGDKSSFFVHHQGGGWCVDMDDCVQRAQTDLGSSKNWLSVANCDDANCKAQPCVYDGNDGLQSTNKSRNSISYNWHKVYVGYCDGASFSGQVIDKRATVHNGFPLHFKGRYILDAVYDTLLTEFSLGSSKHVILSGTSAGGLAVFLHVDYIASKIRSYARQHQQRTVAGTPLPIVAGVPDAGYFMDIIAFDKGVSSKNMQGNNTAVQNARLYTKHFQWVFNTQNVSHSLHRDCVFYYNTIDSVKTSSLGSNSVVSESWKCMFAPYTLEFIKTPLFIVNSLVDNWQGYNIMGLTCDPLTQSYTESTKPSGGSPQSSLNDGYQAYMAGIVKERFTKILADSNNFDSTYYISDPNYDLFRPSSNRRPLPFRLLRQVFAGVKCLPEVFPYLNLYRRELLRTLTDYLHRNSNSGKFVIVTMTNYSAHIVPLSGVWLCNCWTHGILKHDHYFNNVLVHRTSMHQAIAVWFSRITGSADPKESGSKNLVYVDGRWGSNRC